MKLNLITLETVKSELGLSVSTHDVAITAMIPKVSADVRRILNTNYDDYVSAELISGDNTVYINSDLFMGQVVDNASIPDDTYIISYSKDTGLYTLSGNPTGNGDHVYPTVNIAMWSAISKMIWYRIDSLNTDVEDLKGVQSERIGSISVTYSEAEINKQWNYPQILIDDLGVPFSKVG